MVRNLAVASFVAMLLVVGSCGGDIEIPKAAAPIDGKAKPSGRLETPFPIEPFAATDLDGRDAFATWRGGVVIVNFWATWCAPCRREIPALVKLQDKYRDRLLVIGLLQDNVTDAFAREYGKVARVNYPLVRSTFELESRFPPILALPATFVIDGKGRLVAMWAGEVDAAELEQELTRLFLEPRVFRPGV